MAKLRPESFPMTSPGMRMAKNASQNLRDKAGQRDLDRDLRAQLRPGSNQRPEQGAPEPIPTMGTPIKVSTSDFANDNTRQNFASGIVDQESYVGIGQEGLPTLEVQETTSLPGMGRVGSPQAPQSRAGEVAPGGRFADFQKTYNTDTGQMSTNMERGQQLVSKPKGFNRNMKKGGY
jgi:hypothetical protein